MLGSSKWAPSLGLLHQCPLRIFPFPHTCHMSCPSHFSWHDHSNDIWWKVQSMLCSLFHFLVTSSLLGPNTLLSTLFSRTLSQHFSLNMSDQVSHPCKIDSRIIVPYIFIFTYLGSKLYLQIAQKYFSYPHIGGYSSMFRLLLIIILRGHWYASLYIYIYMS
jgi:hypothetical protein